MPAELKSVRRDPSLSSRKLKEASASHEITTSGWCALLLAWEWMGKDSQCSERPTVKLSSHEAGVWFVLSACLCCAFLPLPLCMCLWFLLTLLAPAEEF